MQHDGFDVYYRDESGKWRRLHHGVFATYDGALERKKLYQGPEYDGTWWNKALKVDRANIREKPRLNTYNVFTSNRLQRQGCL